MKKVSLLVSFLFLGLGLANAQSTSSVNTNDPETINWENFELELEESSTDWSIHTDQDRKVVYIDFEALGGNMSKLVLLDANKEIKVVDDRLFDLPSNTIYEINLADFGEGNFSLELYTYTSVIKEEINIK